MSPPSPSPISCHIPPSSHLWHQRLGHPSPARLQLLHKLFPFISVPFDNTCDVYPVAKQTWIPFPSSNITSKFPFQLLHYDIWGPQCIKSHCGALFFFFLIIVDDFNRCTDTQYLLKNFIAFVQTQFNFSIKTTRSDNGSEFLSMQPLFLSHGRVSTLLHLYFTTK